MSDQVQAMRLQAARLTSLGESDLRHAPATDLPGQALITLVSSSIPPTQMQWVNTVPTAATDCTVNDHALLFAGQSESAGAQVSMDPALDIAAAAVLPKSQGAV